MILDILIVIVVIFVLCFFVWFGITLYSPNVRRQMSHMLDPYAENRKKMLSQMDCAIELELKKQRLEIEKLKKEIKSVKK